MKGADFVTLGFDPGGKNHFGWAVVGWTESGRLVHEPKTGCRSSARGALRDAHEALKSMVPVAIGIDAPLFWSTGQDDRDIDLTDRWVDQKIRERIPDEAKQASHKGVLQLNQLRGACLVQGVLIARLACEKWPRVLITEVHPNALGRVEICVEAFKFAENFKPSGNFTKHQTDAILCAFAAMKAHKKDRRWEDLLEEERNNTTVFSPVADEARLQYFFPKENYRYRGSATPAVAPVNHSRSDLGE